MILLLSSFGAGSVLDLKIPPLISTTIIFLKSLPCEILLASILTKPGLLHFNLGWTVDAVIDECQQL